MENETKTGLLVTEFILSDAHFGINAQLILEVVKMGRLTPVHRAPEEVVGICNLRGRIVTVVDMKIHLQLGVLNQSSETRMLIMENRGEAYGFLVDMVTNAIVVEESLLEPCVEGLPHHLSHRLLGVWRESDRLISILDPKTLFQWKETLGNK